MGLHDEIILKIPEQMHEEKDLLGLQGLIRINNSKTKEETVEAIKKEINSIETWLKQNNSTSIESVKQMSIKVGYLDRLKEWKQLCEEFL